MLFLRHAAFNTVLRWLTPYILYSVIQSEVMPALQRQQRGADPVGEGPRAPSRGAACPRLPETSNRLPLLAVAVACLPRAVLPACPLMALLPRRGVHLLVSTLLQSHMLDWTPNMCSVEAGLVPRLHTVNALLASDYGRWECTLEVCDQ